MFHLLKVPELSSTAPAAGSQVFKPMSLREIVHIQRQHHSSTFQTYACVIDAKSPMAKRSPKARLSSRLPVTVTPNIKGKASGYRKRLNSQAVHITYVQIYQLYAKHRSTYYSFHCHKKALYEERGKEGCGYRVAPVGKPGAWERGRQTVKKEQVPPHHRRRGGRKVCWRQTVSHGVWSRLGNIGLETHLALY